MSCNVTIYHNPRCSKSRTTLALLRDRGIEPTIIEYLKVPPSEDELTDILERLKMSPRQLLRKGEAAFKELGLKNPDLPEAKVIRAMAENPILIERPIVITAKGAALCRPPEKVLEIL